MRKAPLLVFSIFALASFVALIAGGPEHAWLFTGDQGANLGAVVTRWWLVLLPLGLGAASIAAITLIGAKRAAAKREAAIALDYIALGCLGIVALTSSLTVGMSWWQAQKPTRPNRPPSPMEVFLPEQWWEVSQPLDGLPAGHLAASGVGVVEHPGWIPFDPFLLERFSFVGLGEADVERLLGPPAPPRTAWDTSGPRYYMVGGPAGLSGSLRLGFGGSRDGRPVVTSQWVGVNRPIS